VALQLLERIPQRSGELPDAAALELRRVEVVQVLLHRSGRLELAFDPVETRSEHCREGEVRVGGRVRAAQLDAGAIELALADLRYADERGSVDARPADVDRRLVAGNEPLVAVHQRREDGDHPPGMFQGAGDVMPGGFRQA